MIAGTQHGGRPGSPSDHGPCAAPRNPHDPSPAIRALLVALDEWVAFDRPPPDSRLPRIDNGTLVPADRLGFPAIPGLTTPTSANVVASLPDWTDPAEPASAYTPLVPAVDADGNETSGIPLPDIAVPRGTYTGWNIYRAPHPAGELADRDGTFLAFAATRAEREAARASAKPSWPASSTSRTSTGADARSSPENSQVVPATTLKSSFAQAALLLV